MKIPGLFKFKNFFCLFIYKLYNVFKKIFNYFINFNISDEYGSKIKLN